MKNAIKKRIFVFVILISCISGIFAQINEIKDKSVFSKANLSSANKNIESEEVVVKETFIPNAQMAMSSPDYLVTAGDVYTLAFAMGTTPVSYTMTVDSSYKIRVANLGIVNAKGLSFSKNCILIPFPYTSCEVASAINLSPLSFTAQ